MQFHSFAVLSDLREKPVFRTSNGREFTDFFKLSDGTDVRLFVEPIGSGNGPFRLTIVDDEQSIVGKAAVASDTSQVFRDLGLLVHFRRHAD